MIQILLFLTLTYCCHTGTHALTCMLECYWGREAPCESNHRFAGYQLCPLGHRLRTSGSSEAFIPEISGNVDLALQYGAGDPSTSINCWLWWVIISWCIDRGSYSSHNSWYMRGLSLRPVLYLMTWKWWHQDTIVSLDTSQIASVSLHCSSW